MLINILLWIVVGLVAGWLASMIMGRGGYGVVGDIVVGLVGALIGGILLAVITGSGLNSNDPISWLSLIVAVLGAIILIAVLRALSGGRTRL